MKDEVLLGEFARTQSEKAFRQLVDRYLPLVMGGGVASYWKSPACGRDRAGRVCRSGAAGGAIESGDRVGRLASSNGG